VLNEKVSADAARREYGVVIDLQRMAVDYPATGEIRRMAATGVGAEFRPPGTADVALDTRACARYR
jgi:hypothetical protein